MKIFICVVFLATVVLAEPPLYRTARYRVERRELEESGSEKESADVEEAPYAAAGFKPSKEFRLPSRQEVAPPSIFYGVPDDSYTAPFRIQTRPEVFYGVPRMTKREEGEKKEESEGKEGEEEKGEKSEKKEKGEESEEGEGEAEELKGEKKTKKKRKGEGEKKENLEEGPEKEGDVDDIVSTQGIYYVLLPGSQLQKVQFNTENDLSKMAYTARLQYKNEDQAPLVVYSSVPQYTVPVAESVYQYPNSAAYFQLF